MEGFAATAAHQLAEPLIVAESGAIMVAEELGDDLDPELRARLDAIGRGAARARQMVDALLMDARSRQRLELRPSTSTPVVGAGAGGPRAPFATARHRRRRRRCPTVRAEPRLLAVIFENLLSNALKYGPRDGGRIEIPQSATSDGWRLIVASEGAPLPADRRERIFEPFRRVPGERRAPGSGLGLAICARLVDRLGGSIGVEPRADGNTFCFVLPAA